MFDIKVHHPKYVLVGGDFSQLEVKTAVYTSKDEKMKEAYESGKDLYSLIGSMAYNLPYEQCLEFYPEGTEIEIEGKKIICGHKTHTNVEGKKIRQASKPILIGSIYQRGIASIAEQIHKSKEETQEIMDRFYKAFPTITAWMEERKQFVRKYGYVDNAVGRRRHLPDATLPRYSITLTEKVANTNTNFNPLLGCGSRKDNPLIDKYNNLLNNVKSRKDYLNIQKKALEEGVEIHDNQAKIAQAERQSVNYPCQSLGADTAKLALINLDKDEIMNKLGFRVLIQVHDEFIGECPKENADKVAERLTEIMINSAKQIGIDVPMSADNYIVSHWYLDEVESSILSTFKSLVSGTKDKQPLSEKEALQELYKEHCEIDPQKIHDFVINDTPIDF